VIRLLIFSLEGLPPPPTSSRSLLSLSGNILLEHEMEVGFDPPSHFEPDRVLVLSSPEEAAL